MADFGMSDLRNIRHLQIQHPTSKLYFCTMKILMVCLGNICRSPLAEGVLQHKTKAAGLDWIVDSAGTGGHNPGCAPHHLSQKVAKHYGINISHHQCRQFLKEDMDRFDKIYVMDQDNYDEVKRIAGNKWNAAKVDFLLNEIYPGQNKDIFDPWYGGVEGFYEVYEMIEKACEAVVGRYISQANQQEDFWEFTDKLAKKAEANGLTEDILKDILDE